MSVILIPELGFTEPWTRSRRQSLMSSARFPVDSPRQAKLPFPWPGTYIIFTLKRLSAHCKTWPPSNKSSIQHLTNLLCNFVCFSLATEQASVREIAWFRINLFYYLFSPSSNSIFVFFFRLAQASRQKKLQHHTRPVENAVLMTKGLQERKTYLFEWDMMKNR